MKQGRQKWYGRYGHDLTKMSHILLKMNQIMFEIIQPNTMVAAPRQVQLINSDEKSCFWWKIFKIPS